MIWMTLQFIFIMQDCLAFPCQIFKRLGVISSQVEVLVNTRGTKSYGMKKCLKYI